MSAVKAGAGREEAHAIIKEHAVAAALEIREGTSGNNDLIDRIADDPNLPLDGDTIKGILSDHNNFIGLAEVQVQAFVSAAAIINSAHPEAGSYHPSPIL
jgi:adenylosuccinate lyase